MMPNKHFALSIKKLASPIFPLLTLCFFTSKLSKLFHIVFPHLKPCKAFLFLFASSLGVLYWRSWGFSLSSFHNASFFFLPSCLFMCLLHLPTLHVCFAYFTNLMSLFCLPCVFSCLLPLPICCLLPLHVCHFAYFMCLSCVLALACFAYLVCLLRLPTLSFVSCIALPPTPAYFNAVTYFRLLLLVSPLAFACFACSVCFMTYSCLLVPTLPPTSLLASLYLLSLASTMVVSIGISLTFACFVAYLPTLLFSCLSFKLAPLAWCSLPFLFV